MQYLFQVRKKYLVVKELFQKLVECTVWISWQKFLCVYVYVSVYVHLSVFNKNYHVRRNNKYSLDKINLSLYILKTILEKSCLAIQSFVAQDVPDFLLFGLCPHDASP